MLALLRRKKLLGILPANEGAMEQTPGTHRLALEESPEKHSHASTSPGSIRLGLLLLAIAPAALVLCSVFLVPMVLLAANSLHPNLGLGEIGTRFTAVNYKKFLGDPFYLEILARTLGLGLVVVASCLVLGFPVSYFLARKRGKARSAMIFLVVAPLLISLVIRNLGWLPILGDSGLVNWMLLHVGLLHKPIPLINNFVGVVIGLVHACLPFMILSLTVVIQRIEPQIEEVATSLGARPLQKFFLVVLPLSRAGVITGSLLVFTMAISAYTTPVMLGGNRVLVMSTFIAQQFLLVLNYPFGAAAAVILVMTTCFLASLSFRNRRGT